MFVNSFSVIKIVYRIYNSNYYAVYYSIIECNNILLPMHDYPPINGDGCCLVFLNAVVHFKKVSTTAATIYFTLFLLMSPFLVAILGLEEYGISIVRLVDP